MYPRISRRLLSHCVVKSKYGRSLRSCITHTRCQVFSIAHRSSFSTSSIQRSEGRATELDCRSNEFENAQFDHETDSATSLCHEPPDEFDEGVSITSIDHEAITNNEPEKIQALRVVLQDIQSLRDKGSQFVPTEIPLHRWEMLMECRTERERRALLKHLFLMEKRDQVEQRKKAELRLKYKQKPKSERQERTTSSPVDYKLSCNSLFYRQRQTTIASYYNYRLAMAEWFGSSLIIDCGYESYMNMREIHHCCTQLSLSWINNRFNPDPFNMIFCNTDENSAVYKYFAQLIPTVNEAENPVNFTKKHYLDLFPAEKLIYLSPHSEHEMTDYEPDSVYIIGAFVDEVVHDPVSMQRAERDGIRTAKFPLDKYLNWCQGSQFLPMNQCVAIMSRVRNGVSWEQALRCVARRKLNYVGLNFKKVPKVDLKSSRHMWAIYSYEMGKEPTRNSSARRPKRKKLDSF